ncbi:M23 family metallopeptidase [Bacillus sp. FJAT-49732]|uniref:M23 family metallopeptidase n=1 Tax=Lederbergia citrisecunda TaxID=2833583 RepID=A0A942TPQ2_9BACI|nr:M23 family metallopeptidase [Lederbergia citrisecunda]MBS4199807.1 M23 family metallopeptidase [Lederbergia citrisecunda]
MSRRADDIRKRISKRRKQYNSNKERVRPTPFIEDEFESPVFEADPKDSLHPLFNRDIFLFKVFASAVLVLVMAIIFQSTSSKLDQIKLGVKKTMEKEFQFAAVSQWYENQFGKPLALLPPLGNDGKIANTGKETDYAIPVSGRILEDFSINGRGIIMETGTNAEVEAITGGIVVFAGPKEDIGQTVIIQHPDHSETWYGMLEKITVKPKEKIEAGKNVGIVSTGKAGKTGEFYFAIKQNDKFIDPIQVIKFE